MKRCPSCAEKIQDEALVCRHCGTQFDEAEVDRHLRTKRWKSLVIWGLPILLIGSCMFRGATDLASTAQPVAAGGCDPAVQSCLATPAAPARQRVTVERFSWQSYGDRYCEANAKIRNDSGEPVRFLRIELQFLKAGEIVDADSSYATSDNILPGETSTWTAMYRCPGKSAEVEVTATAQGEPVTLDFKDGS